MTSTRPGIAHRPRGQTTIEYLPLEEVRVKAWVLDVSSRIVLAQTFYNPSSEPTGRAKYVFPLPANSAVCAFELELENGSVIVGEVKEKEEAALDFTRATEQGKTAALVERVTDDIFTISVGSIPATARVVAHLTFVMDLLDEALQDHVRLQLPMYVAERYGTLPAAMHNTSTADPRTRVRINVDIQTSDVIYDVRSPTHLISRRRYKGRSDQISQRRMSAVWKSPEFLTSDFVITIHAEGLDKPRCFAEVLDARRDVDGEQSTIAMQLTLVPKFQAPKVPSQEYVFIIDRSGSMANASIETAKRTLTMLLRLLPNNQTTFNIVSFGSTVTGLWQRSRVLDRLSLGEATSHVASMSADYGGTEIFKALQFGLKLRGLDRPAVLFLLTDGQIYENEALNSCKLVSDAVRTSLPQASVRLFVLGIGYGVSSDVCARLARHGNGERLLALAAEQIYGKCAQLLNAGRSKNIERIDINWGDNAASPSSSLSPSATPTFPAVIPALAPPPLIQQAPHSLTKIFSGVRFTVFAITSLRTIPTSVMLKTKLEGIPEPQELMVDVTKVKPFRDTNQDSTVPMVHILAARKLIMELDDKVGPLPTPDSGDALLVSEDDLRKAGIVRLGLTYQLVSEHTSFVAVQKGDERIRDRRRRGGSMAWARSRLRQTNPDAQQNNPAEAPTFLDDLISGVSSLITSIFGLFNGPVASTNGTTTTTSLRLHHRTKFPGTYDESDSGATESSKDRGRGRHSSPPRGRSLSRSSANTFSTLSSLEGSSCSSCWTSSRPSSPPPHSHDPVERAPSPEFLVNTGNPVQPRPSTPVPIRQEVFDLFEQMDVDGSFTASPLLVQLVGEEVLRKADELGIDRKIWTTAVVVAYMKLHLQGEPHLLDLVSEKAREFVEAVPERDRASFDQMVRDATALLSP